MYVIIGYFKGETFIVGYTGSRARAERWVAQYPNGTQNEYDSVEFQLSGSI